MKKVVILLFLPYIIFSQQNISFNLFNEYSYLNEDYEDKSESKYINSLLPFSVLLADIAINVGMREKVYRNNHQDNWWGTVNGALTLGLGGTIVGYGISYGIYKIADEKFDEVYTVFGVVLGLAGGVTAAFFSPFKEAFRENVFLYYTYPTLFAAGLTYVIIDILSGKQLSGNNKKRNYNVQVNSNSLIFQLRF